MKLDETIRAIRILIGTLSDNAERNVKTISVMTALLEDVEKMLKNMEIIEKDKAQLETLLLKRIDNLTQENERLKHHAPVAHAV